MSSDVRETEYGSCASALKRATLKELCGAGGIQTGPFGSQLHKEDYVQVGTPIVTVEHLGENCFTHQNLPRVSDSDRHRLAKYTLKAGDIVFSRVGSVDRRALVSKEEHGWMFSGRCLRVRPNQSLVDSNWLSYFFGQEGFKSYIRGIAVGATMPSLNTSILENVPVYFPEDLELQKRCAGVLSAFDKEIKNLRRQNTVLESLAKTIYRSWFLNFDPVHSKAAGIAPEGMAPELASLFTNEFEDSESGAIPKGWSPSTVGDAFEVNPRRQLPKGVQAPFLDMANVMTQGHRPAQPLEMRVAGSGTKFTNGDTLLARITPCLENGKTAFVDFLNRGEVGGGSTEFIVLRSKGEMPPYWSYLLARDGTFRAFAIKAMTGTSGRQRVEVSTLKRFPVVVPPESLSKAVSPLFESIRQQIACNAETIHCLSKLRDHLLPRLISGKLSLEDAEASVAKITSGLKKASE